MIDEQFLPRSLSNSSGVSLRKDIKHTAIQKIAPVRDSSQNHQSKKPSIDNPTPNPLPHKERKKTKMTSYLPPLNPNHQYNIEISKRQAINKKEVKQRSNVRHLTFNQNKENLSVKNLQNELKSRTIIEKRRASHDILKREMLGKEDDTLSYDVLKNSKYAQGHFISSKMFIHIKSYFSKSIGGLKENGFEKVNQDSILTSTLMYKNKDMNMFGIFDGHGDEGHLISAFLLKYFEDYFGKNELMINARNLKEIYALLVANNYSFIRQSFVNADKELKKNSLEFNCYDSGSTGLLMIQIGNKIISANVGDSRGIMVTSKKTIIPLSVDHKPELPQEQSRIEKSGGTVIKDDGNGPFRVWKENKDYPGLAMSRSLGDLDAKLVGVIPEPDIYEFTLDGLAKYIILASDGIWEFLSNEQAAQLGKAHYMSNTPEEYCNKLINEASSKWKSEGNRRDDISAIIIFL